MQVCVHAYMHACLHVAMHVHTYNSVHVSMDAYMCICRRGQYEVKHTSETQTKCKLTRHRRGHTNTHRRSQIRARAHTYTPSVGWPSLMSRASLSMSEAVEGVHTCVSACVHPCDYTATCVLKSSVQTVGALTYLVLGPSEASPPQAARRRRAAAAQICGHRAVSWRCRAFPLLLPRTSSSEKQKE